MNILLICIVLLFLAAGFGMWVGSIRNRHIRKIRKLKLDRVEKDNKLADLKAEVILRRSRVATIQQEVDSLLAAKVREEEANQVEPGKVSAVEYLQKTGVISSADINKAKEFKDNSGSEASLDEILVLLGLTTPEDMSKAKTFEKSGDF